MISWQRIGCGRGEVERLVGPPPRPERPRARQGQHHLPARGIHERGARGSGRAATTRTSACSSAGSIRSPAQGGGPRDSRSGTGRLSVSPFPVVISIHFLPRGLLSFSSLLRSASAAARGPAGKGRPALRGTRETGRPRKDPSALWWSRGGSTAGGSDGRNHGRPASRGHPGL